MQAYLSLIQELLDCVTEEEADILSANLELVDEGLVEVMRSEAEKMAERGEGAAGWLWNFAGKVEAADYSVPQLQKAEADRLLQRSVRQSQGNLPQKIQAVDLAGEQKAEAERLFQQGVQQDKQFQYPQALQSFQQSLHLYQAIRDKRGMANSWGMLGVIEQFGATGIRRSVCISNL